MTTLPRCTSWLGHKFKPRYSSEPALAGRVTIPEASEELIEKLAVKRTYEGDICVRCGLRIDRRRE